MTVEQAMWQQINQRCDEWWSERGKPIIIPPEKPKAPRIQTIYIETYPPIDIFPIQIVLRMLRSSNSGAGAETHKRLIEALERIAEKIAPQDHHAT